jgi:hypothetical protein
MKLNKIIFLIFILTISKFSYTQDEISGFLYFDPKIGKVCLSSFGSKLYFITGEFGQNIKPLCGSTEEPFKNLDKNLEKKLFKTGITSSSTIVTIKPESIIGAEEIKNGTIEEIEFLHEEWFAKIDEVKKYISQIKDKTTKKEKYRIYKCMANIIEEMTKISPNQTQKEIALKINPNVSISRTKQEEYEQKLRKIIKREYYNSIFFSSTSTLNFGVKGWIYKKDDEIYFLGYTYVAIKGAPQRKFCNAKIVGELSDKLKNFFAQTKSSEIFASDFFEHNKINSNYFINGSAKGYVSDFQNRNYIIRTLELTNISWVEFFPHDWAKKVKELDELKEKFLSAKTYEEQKNMYEKINRIFKEIITDEISENDIENIRKINSNIQLHEFKRLEFEQKKKGEINKLFEKWKQ